MAIFMIMKFFGRKREYRLQAAFDLREVWDLGKNYCVVETPPRDMLSGFFLSCPSAWDVMGSVNAVLSVVRLMLSCNFPSTFAQLMTTGNLD